jgi:Na+/proline symporter
MLPHMWQRNYMADSVKTLGKSAMIGSIMALIFIVIPSLIMGFLGVAEVSLTGGPDSFVPTLFSQAAPKIVPLLVLATFAAGMSTIDSQLLSASSVLLRDIVEPVSGKEISEENKKRIGRFFLLGFVTLLAVLALTKIGSNTIVFVASKGTGIATLFLIPLLGALFIKKLAPYTGVMVLGFGAAALFLLEVGVVNNKLSFGAPVLALLIQIFVFTFFYLKSKFSR